MPSEADLLYADLKSKGYSGSIADMSYAYLQAKVGPLPNKSMADLMRLYTGPKNGAMLDFPLQSLSSYIAFDDFNSVGQDQYIHNRPTPVGSKVWNAGASPWVGDTGRVKVDFGSQTYATIDVGVSTYVLECTLTTGNSLADTAGIMVSFFTDSTRLEIGAVSGGWEWRRVIAYSSTYSASGSVATNTTYNIKVYCTGLTYLLYVNDVYVSTSPVIDTDIANSTVVGLWTGSSANGARWDNFGVKPYTAPS
jgi:hypothetical protein